MKYTIPFKDTEVILVEKQKELNLPLVVMNCSKTRGVMLEAILKDDKIIGILFTEANNVGLIELKKYKIFNSEVREKYFYILYKFECVGTPTEFKTLLSQILKYF
jgi:hypothetical protein